MTTAFHHPMDRYAAGKGKVPEYKGVDSLVVYTLTNGATSEFMDIKLCKDRCVEQTSLNSAIALETSAKILVAAMLICMLLIDEEDYYPNNKIK